MNHVSFVTRVLLCTSRGQIPAVALFGIKYAVPRTRKLSTLVRKYGHVLLLLMRPVDREQLAPLPFS